MTKVRRAPSRRPFSIVPDDILLDTRLSLQARAVLAYLVGRPEGWEYRLDLIIKVLGIGRDAWRRARKELADMGYLTHTKVRDEKGRLAWEFVVHDEPTIDGITMDGFPGDGEAVAGNPGHGHIDKQEEVNQEEFKQSSSINACAHARETPALPGGGAAAAIPQPSTPTPTPGGGQQGKARRRRPSGIVTWNASDIEEAERIEQQHDAEDIRQAADTLQKQGLEPVPGRVEKELERLAARREAARRQEHIMTMASQPAFDPQAKAKGEALLSKIRALRKERELHHEAGL